MPSKSPKLLVSATDQLVQLAQRIRAQRKRLSVSATVTAQAAGLSRVTLYRIEKGDASVTIGSYLNVLSALGMALTPTEGVTPGVDAQDLGGCDASVRISDFPQLKNIAWQLASDAQLSAKDAFATYERNWRYVDVAALSAKERALVERLKQSVGQGFLLGADND